MKKILIFIMTFAAAVAVMLICGGATANNDFVAASGPGLLSEPMDMLLVGGFLIVLGKIAKKKLRV